MKRLAYLFFILCAFSGAAHAQIVSVGTPTTQWSIAQKQAAGYFYWPDTDIGIQQVGGTYYLDAANGSPGSIYGFTTTNLATFPSGYGQQGNNWPGNGGAGSFDENYSGGGPIYYDATDGLLIMFYHGEYWYGGGGNPFISGIGMAVSSNLGASWTKLGEIIAPNITWANLTACGANQSEDIGSGSYVINGGNVYIYFTDYSNTQCQDQYLAVASAPLSSVIAAAKAGGQPSGSLFQKYSSGSFSTPGVNNPAAPQNGGGTSDNLNPPGVNPGGMAHPNVQYNSAASAYLMVWFDATGIGISESSNGISWSSPQAIFSDGTPPGGGNSYVYPILLNTSGGSPTTLGSTFTMWYLGNFSGGSNGNLMSVPLTLVGGGGGGGGGGGCSGSGLSWSCAAGTTTAQVQTALGSAGAGAIFTFAPGNYNWSNSRLDMAGIDGVTLICATAPPATGAATANQCLVIFNGSYIGISQIGGVPNGATVSGEYRISGFQLQGAQIWFGYGCSIYPNPCTGTLQNVRVDHNTFDNGGGGVSIYVGDENSYMNVYGVIDHNKIQSSKSLYPSNAGNGSILQWVGGANPTPATGQLGSGNNLFVENNDIDFGLANGGAGMTDAGLGIIDSYGGAAIVARYNTSVDGLWTAHAVTHGGGYNNLEMYGNSISVDSAADPNNIDCTRCIHTQGANTNIFFNNNFTPAPGQGHGDAIDVLSYRDYAFGGGGTPGAPGWSIDGGGAWQDCDGNFNLDGNRGPTTTWFGYPCWHQPGRDTNGTYKPMYGWNNTWTDGTAFENNGGFSMSNHFAGTPVNPGPCMPGPAGTCDYSGVHEVQNRDFYYPVSASAQTSPTSPFNGSTGMGFGALANRPPNCTTSSETAYGNGAAGVGYFATDDGPQGTLFTCSATNVWTVYYTPYTYPHPLVGGSSTPVVAFSPTSHNFGSVPSGTRSSTVPIVLTNTGTATLVINLPITLTGSNPTQFAFVGTGCTTTGSSTFSVAAGGSCTMFMQFAPTTAGSLSASISVNDNAAGSPQTVPLSGTGTSPGAPAVTLSPTSLAFGSSTVGIATASQTITVTNSGTASLSISSVTLAGSDPGDFSFSTQGCPSTLAATISCPVSIFFAPTTTGARSATLSIVDSASGSPHTAALTGTGVSPASPSAVLSPSSINFGSVNVGGTSATQTVTLSNTGNGSLTISSIAVTGANSGDFSITAQGCGSTLAAMTSCTMSVEFAPSAAGARTASISVTDNASGSPHTMSLAGTGVTTVVAPAPVQTIFVMSTELFLPGAYT